MSDIEVRLKSRTIDDLNDRELLEVTSKLYSQHS
jgi:CRP-like cAMP-binding protein